MRPRGKARIGIYLSWKTLHVLASIGTPGDQTTAAWTAGQAGVPVESARRILRRLKSCGMAEREGRVWLSTAHGYEILQNALQSKLKGFRYSDPNSALEAVTAARVAADRLRGWGWRGHLVHKALKRRPIKMLQRTIRTTIKRADNRGAYARACVFAKNAILNRAANWASVVFGGVRGAIRLFLQAVNEFSLSFREVKRLTRELVKEPGHAETVFSWADVERAMARVRA